MFHYSKISGSLNALDDLLSFWILFQFNCDSFCIKALRYFFISYEFLPQTRCCYITQLWCVLLWHSFLFKTTSELCTRCSRFRFWFVFGQNAAQRADSRAAVAAKPKSGASSAGSHVEPERTRHTQMFFCCHLAFIFVCVQLCRAKARREYKFSNSRGYQ